MPHIIIDIVFSPDSIIAAVGMVDNVRAMIAAMVVPVEIALVAEGLGQKVQKVQKGCICFAMGLSVAVDSRSGRHRYA